jgi:predicted helicase
LRTEKASEITNDPNDWAEHQGNPRYLIDLIARVVTVSVQTVGIIRELPSLDLLEPQSGVD